MSLTIEDAYKLADEYAIKTDGYVGIRIMRYNFPYNNKIEVDYVLTAQALGEPKSFRTLEMLVERLRGLLGVPDKDEPEYCNVSGIKLGKREECEHQWNHGEMSDTYCGKCGERPCQHECDQSCVITKSKCKCAKCGGFYR